MRKPNDKKQFEETGIEPSAELRDAYAALCEKKAKEVHDVLCGNLQQGGSNACVNSDVLRKVRKAMDGWESALDQFQVYKEQAMHAERAAQQREEEEFRARQRGGRVTRRNTEPF